jgi:NOL1/NOP2/fmu family ribosome biogenesis protein
MKVEILDRTKKKKIMEKISKNYGIEEIDGLFIKTGKEKIRLFTGEIGWGELNEFAKSVHIEIVGLQLCTVIDAEVRLNFDAINLPEIKNEIVKEDKSVFEASEEEIKKWLNGDNLDFDEEAGKKLDGDFIVVKNQNDLFGVGKNRKTYVQNYVPKERRVRS